GRLGIVRPEAVLAVRGGLSTGTAANGHGTATKARLFIHKGRMVLRWRDNAVASGRGSTPPGASGDRGPGPVGGAWSTRTPRRTSTTRGSERDPRSGPRRRGPRP